MRDHRRRTASRCLLSAVILVGLAAFLMRPQATQAQCFPTTSPTTGQTVNCSGTSTTPVVAGGGQTGITVNVLDGAQLNTTPTAVRLLDGSFINLFGTGSISTTGLSAFGTNIQGNSGTITLNNSSSISTTGIDGIGARIQGDFGTITLNGSSHIGTTGGAQAIGATGAAIFGNSGTITLNDNSSISTANVSAAGAAITGNSGTLTLNGNSSISTTGNSSIAASIFFANSGTITLNGSSSINGTGNLDLGAVVVGDSVAVTLNDSSSISMTGLDSHAVEFQSGSNTLTNHGTLSSTLATTVLGAPGFTDNIFNYGTIYSGSGTAIFLDSGNDLLTLGTGSNITGTIDGGDGTDAVTLTGTGSDSNTFLNWESLTMNGQDWSLSGASSFDTIDVQNGRLAINGPITATGGTTVEPNGILGGDGTLTSDVASTGIIAPGNSVGTLNIVGNFTQTGGGFDVEYDQFGIDRLNVTGTASLLPGPNLPTLTVIPLAPPADTGGSGIILEAAGGITGSFGALDYLGNGVAALSQTATTISLVTLDGTSKAGSDFAGAQTGLDFLDGLAGEQIAGMSGCHGACLFDQGPKNHHLWAQGFGRFYRQDAADGNQEYAYRDAGGTLGGDMPVADGLRLGGALGYANTAASPSSDDWNTSIDSVLGAIYADYQMGRFFVTGAFSGGWQGYDLSRIVTVNSIEQTAQASPDGWLLGANLQAGMCICGQNGWSFVPSLGVDYQHQSVGGYTEQGGGPAGVSMNSQSSDAVRLLAQARVGKDFLTNDVIVTPHASLGVIEQFNMGGTANGSFATGDGFGIAMIDGDRTIGDLGAGVDVSLRNGVALYADYNGQIWGNGYDNAVIGGVRVSW